MSASALFLRIPMKDEGFEDWKTEEARKKWDQHCSYQWTYFSEQAKQLIQFFLSRRIHGRNLDVGAGWYTYHPGSTALDISQKGLDYNCAPNKVLFNLEEVGRGKPLPLSNHSHHSATLVSVWQYVRHRKALLGELERVLVPGSEVFIINQSGSGLPEHCHGPTSPMEIEKEILEAGYDCIRESIPFGEPSNPFQSVTVAMPDTDLFGRRSLLSDRSRKIEESRARSEDPSDFYENCAVWESHRVVRAFQALGTYPITRFSQKYIERLQHLADTLQEKTGAFPAIFLEHDIPASLHLATPESPPFATIMTLPPIREKDFSKDPVRDILEKENARYLCRHIGYMGVSSMAELDYKLKQMPNTSHREERERRDADVRSFVTFLGALPLVSQTHELQKRVYDALKPQVKDLDKRITDIRHGNIHFIGYEHKQRRKINELVVAKKRIIAEGIPTLGEGRLDYLPAIDYYFSQTRESLWEASRAWPPVLSDD